MNNQELFNKALLGVYKQGKQSIHLIHGDCMYRNRHGDMCAAGHIMAGCVPKDSTLWDVEGSVELLEKAAKANEESLPWSESQRSLVILIQSAHDRVYNVEDFTETFVNNMKAIAHSNGLAFPELPEVK